MRSGLDRESLEIALESIRDCSRKAAPGWVRKTRPHMGGSYHEPQLV